jgi:hypothetical protein
MGKLYQDSRTGQRVRQIGGSPGPNGEGNVLVQGPSGPAYWQSLGRLIPCDELGKPDFDATPITEQQEADERPPAPLIDVVETRLDVNTATAEQIFQRVPAITYRTAKRIKALQLAQPGEKWRTLEQLKASAPRLNWDEIFRLNVLFINS